MSSGSRFGVHSHVLGFMLLFWCYFVANLKLWILGYHWNKKSYQNHYLGQNNHKLKSTTKSTQNTPKFNFSLLRKNPHFWEKNYFPKKRCKIPIYIISKVYEIVESIENTSETIPEHIFTPQGPLETSLNENIWKYMEIFKTLPSMIYHLLYIYHIYITPLALPHCPFCQGAWVFGLFSFFEKTHLDNVTAAIL